MEALKVTGVKIDRKEITMLEAEKTIIGAEILPKTAEDKTVTWESKDPAIATVDEKGIITAVAEGETTIQVITNNGNKTDTAKVVVKKKKADETIQIEKMKIEDGYLHNLEAGTTIEELNSYITISDNLTMEIWKDGMQVTKEDTNGKPSTIKTNMDIIIKRKDTDEMLTLYKYVLLGDVDGNGKITAADYMQIKNHITGLDCIKNAASMIAADANQNNKLTAADYMQIKNHITNGTELKK